MNIDAKLRHVLTNLDRALPAGMTSEDVVRAIDTRPPGDLELWLDKIAPPPPSEAKGEVQAFRAAVQAAVALATEAGVSLAELKQRAVDRIESAAVYAEAKLSGGPGFQRPADAAQQAQRLATIKRDYVARAQAAGMPLPNIDLDTPFNSPAQAREYLGGLLAGDMLHWAQRAYDETARMEQAQSPAQLREAILSIDYANVTGGGGPYADYLFTKLDNNFAVADVVEILSRLKYYGYPISVDSQVNVLTKLLERRAGDGEAIEKMFREVLGTAGDNQSTIVANSFLRRAHEGTPGAAAILDRIGFQKDNLGAFGPIRGDRYPDRSALESLAQQAAARPEFKAFEATILTADGKRPAKEALLAAIDGEIAKLRTPEEFVALVLGLAQPGYKYHYPEGGYRSEREINIAWDTLAKHTQTGARLGVSFDWLAALTFAAYFRSIHMTDHGMLLEDAMKVLEPTMAHLRSPEQVDRLMRSADIFIQRTYLNSRQYYPDNYNKAWYQVRNAAMDHLAATFSNPADGPAVVARCGTVDAALKAKGRMITLAGADLPGLLRGLALYFDKPSEAYLRDHERFVLKHLGAITGHPAFDLGALEQLLAVQTFSGPTLAAIRRSTEAAPAYAGWSEADRAAAQAKLGPA